MRRKRKIALGVMALMVIGCAEKILAAGESFPRRPKIGLVLSGGGARGLAHIGVLKVLEEAGIEVDYIAGTSMGGIIGGLYAIGYDAARIEEIALGQDWNELLTDKIPRTSMSIIEKKEEGRYVGALPIRKGKIELPGGLVAGQKISILLSRLTLQVHHADDFRAFPIPFLCIATDLETGGAVVLDKGFLPDALRASMSIPSVFTPVQIDGRLLVDGGLVRNLPASDVRKMGADIVIGVDVGTPLYSKKELGSLVKVLEQSVNFRGAASTEEQQKLCDILIKPDLTGYSSTSFNSGDSLITKGERYARRMLPELQALADSLKKYPEKTDSPKPLKPVSSFYLAELEIEGLQKVSRRLLLGNLQLKVPSVVTADELEQAIDRAYGTHFFERITYRVEPSPQGTRLVLRVIEQTANQFRFGFNYDSNLKAAILLNTTFRNLLAQGSKLSLSTRLSDNPVIEGSYFVHTAWKPGVGLRVEMLYNALDVLTYRESGGVEANFDYSSFETSLLLETIFSNSVALGAGARYHYSSLDIVIAPEGWEGGQYSLLSFLAYLRFDTLNRAVYQTRGVSLYAEAILVTDLLGSAEVRSHEAFQKYTLTCDGAVPVSRRVSILGSFYGGFSTTDQMPSDHFYFLGGAYPYLNRAFPFMGLKFMERLGSCALVLQTGVQVEFRKNQFLILRGNTGETALDFNDLFDRQGILTGLGLTYGWLSPVGPMEYTVMWGSEHKDLLSHVNIGYRF
ncbi:MAG: patatin-like phospholipase family protein [Candidatus Glassbacteria bacterium]|nr:patatin-like phospholipase family protein [Candidatus Glassbacteria bacterium]